MRIKPFAFAREFRDDPRLGFSQISVSMVKRELRKVGLTAYIAKLKNKLQQHHMNARKTFAENRLQFDWKKVVFCLSDTASPIHFIIALQFVIKQRSFSSSLYCTYSFRFLSLTHTHACKQTPATCWQLMSFCLCKHFLGKSPVYFL